MSHLSVTSFGCNVFEVYNFLFHPLAEEHGRKKSIVAVISVIALSILTAGVFTAIFIGFHACDKLFKKLIFISISESIKHTRMKEQFYQLLKSHMEQINAYRNENNYPELLVYVKNNYDDLVISPKKHKEMINCFREGNPQFTKEYKEFFGELITLLEWLPKNTEDQVLQADANELNKKINDDLEHRRLCA